MRSGSFFVPVQMLLFLETSKLAVLLIIALS